MGLLAWLGFWERINSPPKWIVNKSESYYGFYCKKYGHPPYDVIKYFKGKIHLYRIHYETVAQGQIEEKFFKKRRRLT